GVGGVYRVPHALQTRSWANASSASGLTRLYDSDPHCGQVALTGYFGRDLLIDRSCGCAVTCRSAHDPGTSSPGRFAHLPGPRRGAMNPQNPLSRAGLDEALGSADYP